MLIFLVAWPSSNLTPTLPNKQRIFIEHHVPLSEEQYGKIAPSDLQVDKFPCCILIPSKLPANVTLQRVRMGGFSGTASTLIYSDGLKIIQMPTPRIFDFAKFGDQHEGFPRMHKFSYANVEGAGHDPWISTYPNGSAIFHRGHLSFWLEEPGVLYELIGNHTFAELEEVAISMLQGYKARPLEDPMRGKSIQLDEASQVAEKAGFRIRLPSHLPTTQFKLMSVRVAQRYVSPIVEPQLSTEIRLIYSEKPLHANATSLDVLDRGGFCLTLKKRIALGDFEGLNRLVRIHPGGDAQGIGIKGNPGYYFAYPAVRIQAMFWFDQEMEFQIVGSLKGMDMVELIRVAESIP